MWVLSSSEPGGVEQFASRSGRFTPGGGKAAGAQWIGRWLGSRADLDAVGKNEIYLY
jgi:hypothetical protein